MATNGAVANPALGCVGSVHRVTRRCIVNPFTIFDGSIPDFTVPALNIPGFTIPRMTQILPANPKRVMIFFSIPVNGVLVTTYANGQGVSTRICMGTDPVAGNTINAAFSSQDPEAFIADAWFAASINHGAPTGAIVVTGLEVVQAE